MLQPSTNNPTKSVSCYFTGSKWVRMHGDCMLNSTGKFNIFQGSTNILFYTALNQFNHYGNVLIVTDTFYLSERVVATVLKPNSCKWNIRRSWGKQGNYGCRFSPAVVHSKGTKTPKLHPQKSGLNSPAAGKWQISQTKCVELYLFRK